MNEHCIDKCQRRRDNGARTRQQPPWCRVRPSERTCMPKRGRRAQIGLANLGERAQKKPRLDAPSRPAKMRSDNKENHSPPVSPAPFLWPSGAAGAQRYENAMNIYENIQHTFAEISQPTWSTPVPSEHWSPSTAAWAAKKYRSHRVLPADILAELDRARISPTY
ncbi:hypothetical protein C2E23DRAFT_161497 [Lenzites betulinus]|nr:hypothetical protein C2E23DRAFT_161497 [Lenzites betulinus]